MRSPGAAILLLLSVMAMAQKAKDEPKLALRTEPLYLIRITSMHMVSRHIERMCVIVYPDQTFRYERSSQQVVQSVLPPPKVTLGRLSDSLSQRIKTILSDPDVATADMVPTHAGSLLAIEQRSIGAEIPRDRYRVQDLDATTVDKNAPPPGFQLLADFIDALAATDPAITKGAKSTLCARPAAIKVGD